MLKIKVIGVCLFLLSVVTSSQLFAQKINEDFVGVWELEIPKQDVGNGQKMALVHLLKVLNRDGSYANYNLNPENSAITHKGFYTVDDKYYYENLDNQDKDFVIVDLAKAQKLDYRLSEDKNTLYLDGLLKVEGGNTFTLKEVWKKVTIKQK